MEETTDFEIGRKTQTSSIDSSCLFYLIPPSIAEDYRAAEISSFALF